MTELETRIRRRLQASQLRLSEHHPFFGSLLLMAPVEITERFPTAATDGERLYFNPAFVEPLTSEQLDGLVVHELLHCAFLHGLRRGMREPMLWNIAADIHVNALIRELPHLDLPEGAAEDKRLAPLCVEEIYEKLLRSRRRRGQALAMLDILEPTACKDLSPKAFEERLRAHWTDAIHRARAVAEMAQRGTLPAGIDRLIDDAVGPRLDWRTALWRHLVRTPDDFLGFDRRMVWSGLYLDALEGDSLEVDVCVDTSGSVNDEQLREFLGEVRGILSAYPSVRCRLYYADAECAGPFEVDAGSAIPVAKGGGGTDFVPFFRATDPARDADSAARRSGAGGTRLAVYLTDGHGNFPNPAPDRPVLWVVVAGGLESAQFPFGEVVRMWGVAAAAAA
jgi:predicted metal-dependent peptidase